MVANGYHTIYEGLFLFRTRTVAAGLSRANMGRSGGDNEVVRVGRIDEKQIYLLFDYLHKTFNCKAIRLRS